MFTHLFEDCVNVKLRVIANICVYIINIKIITLYSYKYYNILVYK